MADVFAPAKRSAVMSAIRGKGNKSTEQALVAAMRGAGITGWRRHVALKIPTSSTAATKKTTCRPDFTFSKERLIVFVDGCFWHKCPLHFVPPSANAEFWEKKLSGNVARDKFTDQILRRNGWSVLRIWEHDLAPRVEAIRILRRRLSDCRRRQTKTCGCTMRTA